MKKIVLLTLVLFMLIVPCSLLAALDFGLLLNQEFEVDNDVLVYTPGFAPWFSINNGSGLSVYLSALITLPYTNPYNIDGAESDFKFTPELTRTVLGYRVNQMYFEAGRTNYTDAMNFIANGLFDGVHFQMNLPGFTLSANAFYTGLQFKESAKIIMSYTDMENFAKPWGTGDGEKISNYFASRRMFAVVRGDVPLGPLGLSAEALVQFDLNGKGDDGFSDKLHSQYLTVLANFYPASTMRITGGFIFSLLQGRYEYDGKTEKENGVGIGALAQFKMDLPTRINDQAGVTFKFTNGTDKEDSISTFMPISAHSQGMVFPLPLSGLAMFGLNYDARVHSTVYVESAFNYYLRTFKVEGSKGLYGGEFNATIAWQPFDDLRATLGGGLFFPQMGNHYTGDEKDVRWKITIGVSLAL